MTVCRKRGASEQKNTIHQIFTLLISVMGAISFCRRAALTSPCRVLSSAWIWRDPQRGARVPVLKGSTHRSSRRVVILKQEGLQSWRPATEVGSQNPSPDVKTLCILEPQVWPELITSRDVESTCYKGSRTAIASASYRIEKPRIPENRRKIGKKRGNSIICLFLSYISPISPIFCLFLFLFSYSVAGQRNRNSRTSCDVIIFGIFGRICRRAPDYSSNLCPPKI